MAESVLRVQDIEKSIGHHQVLAGARPVVQPGSYLVSLLPMGGPCLYRVHAGEWLCPHAATPVYRPGGKRAPRSLIQHCLSSALPGGEAGICVARANTLSPILPAERYLQALGYSGCCSCQEALFLATLDSLSMRRHVSLVGASLLQRIVLASALCKEERRQTKESE
jgi:hypothetical protein